MSNTLISFGYRNEDDKAYGLAGMIITLSSLDALGLVHSVSLDAEGPMVQFSDEYYHVLSPSLSPKVVWKAMERNFYITSAMVVGNVMARSVVRDGTPVCDSLLSDVRATMESEGSESLSLESDEIDALYQHLMRRNIQLFHNPRLKPKVEQLSRRLSLLRRLSAADIVSELERL